MWLEYGIIMKNFFFFSIHIKLNSFYYILFLLIKIVEINSCVCVLNSIIKVNDNKLLCVTIGKIKQYE